MRKIIFSVITLVFAYTVHAQNNSGDIDTIPPYKKDPNVPPFQILQADSSWYGKNDLPENKPVLIVYFNPECGHCQLIAKEFGKEIDQFRDLEMVWASYQKPAEIDSFAHEYKLSGFPNVHFGRDTRYYIPVFYKIRFTPFMAAYNRKGKLLEVWDEGTIPEKVLKAYEKE